MRLLTVLFSIMLLAGCTTNLHHMKQASMEISTVTESDFSTKLLGKTQATTKVTSFLYLLHFTPNGFLNWDYGSWDFWSHPYGVYIGLLDPISFAVQEAKYDAIEKIPTADAIVGPREKVEFWDFLIIQKTKATVKGSAVQYVKD